MPGKAKAVKSKSDLLETLASRLATKTPLTWPDVMAAFAAMPQEDKAVVLTVVNDPRVSIASRLTDVLLTATAAKRKALAFAKVSDMLKNETVTVGQLLELLGD